MYLLGIETSGIEGSVALLKGEVCVAERPLDQAGRRHAQSLVLEIGAMLRSHNLEPRGIDAVAVSRGPGSFTGLRVGMVCAKTFAYATGCRFVAVETFAAIAENAPAEARRIIVIDDAQRDDLFVGEFHRDGNDQWMAVQPVSICSVDHFIRERKENDIVTGPGLRKLPPEVISPNWFSDQKICRPRASVVAALGYKTLARATVESSAETDFWTASPFYLRPSAAEEKRASLLQK